MTKWIAVILAVVAGALLALWFVPDLISIPDRTTEEQPVEATAAAPEQPLARFLEQASLSLALRSPELITYLGIANSVGVSNDQLTPLSTAYEDADVALLDSVLAQLDAYDLSQVSASERLSARVYGWYLRDLRQAYVYSDHDYLVSTYFTSYPEDVEWFLVYVHPIETLDDATDYLSRLSQIDERFDELAERLGVSESINAVPPRFIMEEAASEIEAISTTPAQEMSYYVVFADKLSETTIPQSTQENMLEQARDIVQSEILPAYAELALLVSQIAERASDEIGVWKHVDGDAYYAECLRQYTTTSLSAEEIRALGLSEVARIQQEILSVASGLGHDGDLSIVELYDHLADTTGAVRGTETVERCEALLEDISTRVRPVFTHWPQEELIVVEGGEDAFFTSGSMDGSRPGMFFAPAGIESPVYSLPTLTYHEAIPGHFLQTAYAHEANIPEYRKDLGFTAYAEGWALYAERLAWELGAYEGDPEGNLGRLQDELFRAVRLVVDTGIHAFRWTYEEAVTYMRENSGLDEEYVRQEIDRYIVLPGQATSYKVGMLKVLELRERAQEALGDAFDLAEFHDVLLGQGDVPLDILEELVNGYIAERT